MNKFQQLSKSNSAGFTLAEIMIALTIVIFLVAAFVSIMRFGGYSMLDINKQTELNSRANNALFKITQRIRYSHTCTVSNGGNTLTLSFDDDPATDHPDDGNPATTTDADENPYNDTDHREFFSYSAAARTLSYQSAAGASPKVILENVQPQTVGTTTIFTLNSTDDRQIDIHFDLFDTIKNNPSTQRIDISTSAYRINGI